MKNQPNKNLDLKLPQGPKDTDPTQVYASPEIPSAIDLQAKANEGFNIRMTIYSVCLLATTITIAVFYYNLFGVHLLTGDNPEHWDWIGGFVGFVAVLIRVVVLLALAVPYIVISATGLSMSLKVLRSSSGFLAWFNGFLVFGHAIILLPAAYVAIMNFLA